MFSVTLIGNVGHAAIQSSGNDGKLYLYFTFAVDTGYGENKRTIWAQCSLNEPENVFQHIYKGRFMYLRGDATLIDKEKDGQKYTVLRVFVNKFRFLDKNIRNKKNNEETKNEQTEEASVSEV